MPKSYRKYPDTFWNQVTQKAIHECWEYSGQRDKAGYGDLGFDGHHTRAHRVAFLLWHKLESIPKGYKVLHGCDNPPCCNPFHLWLGSQIDNIWDRDRKGRTRSSKGELNSMYGFVGVLCPSAKLNDDKVREIRKLHNEGWSPSKLGRRFGVVYQTIQAITEGRTWKHIV